MDFSTILKAVFAPQEGQTAAADGSRLEPGDQLRGRVLKLESDGRILIDLGGSRAQAQTRVAVRPGQVLQLEVVKTGVPLHLRVLTHDGESAPQPVPQMDLAGLFSRDEQQRIADLLGRILARDPQTPVQGELPQTVRQAVSALRTVFEPLSIEKECEAIASGLRTRLEDRGLFFERKLADAVLARPESQSQIQGRPPTLQATERPGQQPASQDSGAHPATAADPTATKPPAPVATPAAPVAGESHQAAQSPLAGSGKGPMAATGVEIAALNEPSGGTGEVNKDDPPADPELAGQEPSAKDAVHPALRERPALPLILMRDLKAQLLVLQSHLSETAGPESPPDRGIAFLERQVQKLLAHVEQQQDRMVQRADDGNPFQVVAHWVSLEEQTRPVKFKVYYPRRDKSGHNGQYHRVALLLDMDRLGLVRVDLASLDKHLRIDFYVEREESRTQIEQHQDKILSILQPGFSEVQLTVRVSRQKIAGFDREDRVTAAMTMGRVDIKA